jgi:hypothetical protein
MSIDYKLENKRLEEFSGDFWKPKAGQYKVKAISEILESEPAQFSDDENLYYAFLPSEPAQFSDDEKAEPQQRAQIKIFTAGKEYLWNFPKGNVASTYGQLVHLGSVKNILTGIEFVVVVV